MLCNFYLSVHCWASGRGSAFPVTWLHRKRPYLSTPRRTPLYHREAGYAYLCLLHYSKAQGAHNAGAPVEKSQRTVLCHNILMLTAMETPK
jgi:hypothetical protein